MLDFLVWVVAAGLVVARGLVVPAVVVPAVVQALLGKQVLAVKAAVVEFTAEAVVQLGIIMQPVAMVLEAQSVSSGPARLVASHQQIRGMYK